MQNKIRELTLISGALVCLAARSFAQASDPFVSLEKSASALLAIDPRTATEEQKAQAEAEAPRIRKELLAAIAGRTFDRVELSMRDAIPAAFGLSSQAEWKDFAAAEAGLQAWLTVLEKSVTDPASRADLALSIGERHINRWMREKPVETGRMMDDFGARYANVATKSALQSWYFFQPESERALHTYARLSMAETRKRLDRFLENEAIPITHRVSMVATMARELYSDGEAEIASKYLTEFSTAHPEAPKSISFRHAWFYVELIGRGDRAKANQILSVLDADVAAGRLQPQEGPIGAMRSALQSREGQTEDELVKDAASKMAEWRARKAEKDQK